MTSPVTVPAKTTHAQASSSEPQGAIAGPRADYVPLTADGLLFFCQERLKDMDTKIQQKMSNQSQLVALQDKILNIQATLKSYGDGEGSFNDEGKVRNLSTLIQNAIAEAKACGNNTLADTLATVDSKIHQGKDANSPDWLVTGGEAKEINATLDAAMTTCGSDAQVSMIELQSLVSKRATQLQLTTGMMNSIDEAPKAIAANIGR